MNFCRTCIFWEGGILNRAGRIFGLCHELAASEKIIVDTNTFLEENIIYTEQFYGCIHHRSDPGILIDINGIIKSML